jgi:hypothetical protein
MAGFFELQHSSPSVPSHNFLWPGDNGAHFLTLSPGNALNSAAGLPAQVQIPVPPSATSRLLYELLGRVRLGFLVVSPFRIACVFLHVERGRSSKRV